jgi:hypothetical protein
MTYLFLFFVLPILTSCHNHPLAAPTAVAEVTIHSPAENAVYQRGDTVHISASIKASVTLHGYDITLRDVTTGSQLYFRHIHVHSNELSVNQYWVHNQKWSNDLTEAAEVELEVAVALDHAGTKETSKVRFTCMP